MRTFSVKNFERFQHYKDRNPPWIKLYNELLDDYEFGRLQDASKMHLIAIWLLASRSDNKLPYDPAWIGKRINATEPVDLDLLLATGFIVSNQPLQQAEQVASATLAECLPREREETEERQRESRGENGANAPASNCQYAWHGKVIRLSPSDYGGWKKAYSQLDLDAELTARDVWLTEQDKATKQKWFQSTSKYLANRNMEARAKGQAAKRGPPEQKFGGMNLPDMTEGHHG